MTVQPVCCRVKLLLCLSFRLQWRSFFWLQILNNRSYQPSRSGCPVTEHVLVIVAKATKPRNIIVSLSPAGALRARGLHQFFMLYCLRLRFRFLSTVSVFVIRAVRAWSRKSSCTQFGSAGSGNVVFSAKVHVYGLACWLQVSKSMQQLQ